MTVYMPAEWAQQDWIWIGFPADGSLWEQDLIPAQEQMAAFANAVAETGQKVRLVVRDAANEARARELVSASVLCERHAYGDIWIRDSGPLVIFDGKGRRFGQRFGFNGWGGKFVLDGDQDIGVTMAEAGSLPATMADWILEGGAIDTDGTGLVVTTEQCLLNPNRNPQLTKAEIEMRLQRDLGFDRVLWLGDGLLGDHTDGHVDNLARFVAPGVVAIPVPSGTDDPNVAVYADARARAREFGLQVRDVPSPGRMDEAGIVEPASYMNFAICNQVVVVPTYGSYHDDAALEAIGDLFPGRAVVGLPAEAVLTGGGSFHCASQHAPASI
ncbi:agmatine deiminase family protein [Croceibacterium sp. LX-88]|uniref:Agmatine deiminase family protein n=1 Tax=Croceibacterium selenioxidans TaxID=2838833 RepID=A0ABS5W6Q8_9SPHN|nr:agmatine deiminase family protein [Croceibacterium selenioxidans]MBT2135440.1 agmatine deiminase family protein [Croceibacterium selenioxidans]